MEPSAITLPVGSVGKKSLGWWGLLTLIATEGALFGYLLFTYYYLTSQAVGPWPPDGLPKLFVGSINTLILLSSSVMVWAAERCLTRGRRGLALVFMALALAMGATFAGVQLHEWNSKPYGPTTNLYGSVYFVVTGFHLAHVFVGLAILLALTGWIWRGALSAKRRSFLTIGGMYWHFVDLVWLFVFSTFYLTPYLWAGS